MLVTLDHIDQETPNISTFWFKTPVPIDYLAGQYVELSLPHDHPDKRGQSRQFSLSSAPQKSPLVSITTKFSPIRSSTFKKTLRRLQIGDKIQMSQPIGDFVLPKDKSIPLVFVAGGMGITPFASIIKFLRGTNEKRQIQMIYAATNEADLIFNDLFINSGLSLYKTISRPSASPKDGNYQRLSAETINELVGGHSGKLIYISGPELMVEKLMAEFINLKIPTSQLVGDYFPNYEPI